MEWRGEYGGGVEGRSRRRWTIIVIVPNADDGCVFVQCCVFPTREGGR